MKLLHTETFKLSEVTVAHNSRKAPLSEVPPYAILSHTWGDEEVSYADIQRQDRARSLTGFKKVKEACALAASQGFHFIWIDTCCIDKSSSSELSEAINSMYHWYKRAAVCYAYLADVDIRGGWRDNGDDVREFETSRWFTRGWTLQELIAPSKVEFYSRKWHPLGRKDEMIEELHRITNIDQVILNGGNPLHISTARRMYWASRRETTREEDMAYCLLGLFDVNMPLLYGEGAHKSFERLQECILRETDDQSIFAWSGHVSRSLLAKSPQYFQNSSNISPLATRRYRKNFSTTTADGLVLGFMAGGRRDNQDNSYTQYIILDCQVGPVPGTAPAIRTSWRKVNGMKTFSLRDEWQAEVMFSDSGGQPDQNGCDPASMANGGSAKRYAVKTHPGENSTLGPVSLVTVPLKSRFVPVFMSTWHLWIVPDPELHFEFKDAYSSEGWDEKSNTLFLSETERSIHVVSLVISDQLFLVFLKKAIYDAFHGTGYSCLVRWNDGNMSAEEAYNKFHDSIPFVPQSSCPIPGTRQRVEVELTEQPISGTNRDILYIRQHPEL